MAKPLDVTNLHILGFLNDRIADLTKLDVFLSSFADEPKEIPLIGNPRKRKLALVSTKRRTSSYMRYKIPRIKATKRARKSTSVTRLESQSKCRRERRNRSILMNLHNIHELEVGHIPTEAGNKATSKWLETHYWHKKRFCTRETWGYCLPQYHKARGKRFLCSAIENEAVIHDSSYIRALQIVGHSHDIREILHQFTDPSTEVMSQSMSQLDSDMHPSSSAGSKCSEIPVLFYRRHQFPSSCIGPATFFLVPDPSSESVSESSDEENVKVWLWCHPAIFSEIKEELMQFDSTSCKISCVPGGMQRFSVRGKKSLSLLGKVLIPTDEWRGMSNFNEDGNGGDGFIKMDPGRERIRESDVSNEEFFRRVLTHRSMTRIWRDGAALGLRVKDVRLLTKHYRDKEHNSKVTLSLAEQPCPDKDCHSLLLDAKKEAEADLTWPMGSWISDIWHDQHRHQSSQCFMKDHELNNRLFKSKSVDCSQVQQVVVDDADFVRRNSSSGIKVQGPDVTSSFPVVIIRKDLRNHSSRRLKNKKNVPFVGFDIILPSKWGSAVWHAFQFAGARAVGVEEMDSIQLDHGVASFPRDYPDTDAGREFWTEKASALHRIDLKRPPLKRLGGEGMEVPYWDGDDTLTRDEMAVSADSDENVGEGLDCESHTMDIDENEIQNENESSCAVIQSDDKDIALDTSNTILDVVIDGDPSVATESQCVSHCHLFNVVREERYVHMFRAESMAQPDTDGDGAISSKDINMAFKYSLMHPLDEKKSSGKDVDFYDKNDALFYSLMQCLVSKQLPYLPSRTMLPVLLVPSCRGVIRDGAVIYSPSHADYLEFVYYHERRSEPSLSSSRQANKRLGEWRGVDMSQSGSSSSTSAKSKSRSKDSAQVGTVASHEDTKGIASDSRGCGGRTTLGCVTSGRYTGSPNGAVSYGLCDAMLLQEMTVSAAQILLEYQRTGNSSAGPPPRGRVLSLVMFKSARSRLLRPALIEIVSVLQ